MIGRMCLVVMFVIMALPAYAGHVTIRETDTEIIVEYSGDENDKQATRVQKEEQEKEEELKNKSAEIKKVRVQKNETRGAEHRKEEE